MNTLSYGLLSLLARSPLSGYDLTLRIQPFWPAKHSQIYPLLANLEKDDQVTYELVAQTDKPDKKVYSITDKGIDSLKGWLSVPASDPVMRDELMLKAYCISLVDPSISRQLFLSRREHYRLKLQRYKEKILKIQDDAGLSEGGIPPYRSPYFGAYILINKAQLTCRTNIEWCEWILTIIPAEEQLSDN